MANGEEMDAAAKKEAFERKLRVQKITEDETKKYLPRQFSSDF